MVDFWQFITNVTAATSILGNGSASSATSLAAYTLPDLPYAYDVSKVTSTAPGKYVQSNDIISYRMLTY